MREKGIYVRASPGTSLEHQCHIGDVSAESGALWMLVAKSYYLAEIESLFVFHGRTHGWSCSSVQKLLDKYWKMHKGLLAWSGNNAVMG